MSRFRFDRPRSPVLVAIGRQACAWRASLRQLSLQTLSLEAGQAALSQLRDTLGPQPIHWILGLDQMPQWLQSAPQGTRSLKELRAVTTAQARHRLNTPGSKHAWSVDGHWHPNQPFLCQALASPLLDALGPRPQVCTLLDAGLAAMGCPARSGWSCVSSLHEAHLAFHERGSCQHLRSFRMDGTLPTADAGRFLLKEWRKEMLRADVASDSLAWLHLGWAETASLSPGLVWASEGLQSHLSKRLGGDPPSTDAEHLLSVFEALSSWGQA